MDDSGDYGHSLPSVKGDRFARAERAEPTVPVDVKQTVILQGEIMPERELESPPPTDDVFLLNLVGVSGCGHRSSRIHQLFAVLQLLGEINENQSEAGWVPESKISDIPSGLGGQRPSMAFEASRRIPNQLVDFTSLHSVITACAS